MGIAYTKLVCIVDSRLATQYVTITAAFAFTTPFTFACPRPDTELSEQACESEFDSAACWRIKEQFVTGREPADVACAAQS